MYGLPELSLPRWRTTLQRALELRPEHLSCYLLTLEPHVPMSRWLEQGRMRLPGELALQHQYQLAREMLSAHGYVHYELSNWALAGRESRHNLTYWRDLPYLGIGAGAASSWRGTRYKNTPHVLAYLTAVEAGQAERIESEETSWPTQVRDYLALALRLREGLDPAIFRSRFRLSLQHVLGEELGLLVRSGHLEWVDGRLRVAEGSLLVTNELLARLSSEVERRGRSPANH
jgi:oxygen-independent coproporphyrinogen-3 oxidase